MGLRSLGYRWPMHPLVPVGLAFEIFGLLVAGIGFNRTFRENASTGQRLWSPLMQTVATVATRTTSALRDRLRAALGRPRTQYVYPPTAESHAVAGAGARVTTSFPPLDADQGEAIKQLGVRTDQLNGDVQDEEFARIEADNALKVAIENLSERFEDELGKDRATRRELAASDSRWQFGGLLLILLGLVIQTTGQVLQANQ
jgi:hypothetical protein